MVNRKKAYVWLLSLGIFAYALTLIYYLVWAPPLNMTGTVGDSNFSGFILAFTCGIIFIIMGVTAGNDRAKGLWIAAGIWFGLNYFILQILVKLFLLLGIVGIILIFLLSFVLPVLYIFIAIKDSRIKENKMWYVFFIWDALLVLLISINNDLFSGDFARAVILNIAIFYSLLLAAVLQTYFQNSKKNKGWLFSALCIFMAFVCAFCYLGGVIPAMPVRSGKELIKTAAITKDSQNFKFQTAADQNYIVIAEAPYDKYDRNINITVYGGSKMNDVSIAGTKAVSGGNAYTVFHSSQSAAYFINVTNAKDGQIKIMTYAETNYSDTNPQVINIGEYYTAYIYAYFCFYEFTPLQDGEYKITMSASGTVEAAVYDNETLIRALDFISYKKISLKKDIKYKIRLKSDADAVCTFQIEKTS